MHEYCVELTCEVAIAKVKQGKSELYVVGVYRTNDNLEITPSVYLNPLNRSLQKNQQFS